MKNRKFRDSLLQVIEEAEVQNGTEKALGALLYEVAVKVRRRLLYSLHKYNFPCMLHSSNHTSAGQTMDLLLQYPKNALAHRPRFIKEYLLSGTIKVAPYPLFPGICRALGLNNLKNFSLHTTPAMQRKDKLTGGLEYLATIGEGSPDWAELEVQSGIGIEVHLC